MSSPTNSCPSSPDDKVTPALVEALKAGLAEPGEKRLYRSGKLPGLFPGRTGLHAQAASRALGDGFLEVVRSETRGKTLSEWVQVTPKGSEFLLQHESPVRAMDELRQALQATQDGLPLWMVQIRQNLQELADRLVDQVSNLSHSLEALGRRIGQALDRAEAALPKVPSGTAQVVPWAQEVLNYLERRRETGLSDPCPLPELFAALRAHQGELSLLDFHTGLRRLQDRGLLQLLPFEGLEALPQPEFALLDGASVFYFVTR